MCSSFDIDLMIHPDLTVDYKYSKMDLQYSRISRNYKRAERNHQPVADPENQ
jgi:hypothetical protein